MGRSHISQLQLSDEGITMDFNNSTRLQFRLTGNMHKAEFKILE